MSPWVRPTGSPTKFSVGPVMPRSLNFCHVAVDAIWMASAFMASITALMSALVCVNSSKGWVTSSMMGPLPGRPRQMPFFVS